MSYAQKVLVLFAHPAPQRSRVQMPMFEAVRALEGVTTHNLYESYPELDIDVAAEQALLEQHSVIILQHPLYWYSTPAILKEWQDLVLEHGWAFGSQGTALQGKWLLNAISAGGGAETYTTAGLNGFEVRDLLVPIEQTAKLCGMIYLPPFAIHGTHGLNSEQITKSAEEYAHVVAALRDGHLTPERCDRWHHLNADLDQLKLWVANDDESRPPTETR